MRQPIVPVAALLIALATGSAFANPEKPSPSKPAQTKSAPAKTAVGGTASEPGVLKATRSKADMKLKNLGVPQIKETVVTPEQIKAQQEQYKKDQQQKQSDRQARRDKFKAIVASYSKQGVEFKRGDKPDTYRLIVPGIAKTSDPTQRKAAARSLATRFKGEVEPLFKKKIEIEVYTDAKATQRIPY